MTDSNRNQLEEVLSNPEAYGIPTFEQFRKYKEKYGFSETFQLDSADNGSTALNAVVKKHIYEIDGYECSTLEELEKVALNQGYKLRDLVMKPELEQDHTNGKLICRIRFASKFRKALTL